MLNSYHVVQINLIKKMSVNNAANLFYVLASTGKLNNDEFKSILSLLIEKVTYEGGINEKR